MVEGSSDDVIGTTTGASQKFEYCGKSSIFVKGNTSSRLEERFGLTARENQKSSVSKYSNIT